MITRPRLTRTEVNKLCDDLISVIDKYLDHELPGQEKKWLLEFFPPAHASQARYVKEMLTQIKKEKKETNEVLIGTINTIINQNAKVQTKEGLVDLGEVLKSVKVGIPLANALVNIMDDFESQSSPEIKRRLSGSIL